MIEELSLIGFVKLELPDGDVRLCEAGLIESDGEVYAEAHVIWGSIGGVEPLSEGVGDEVPALQLTLMPADAATPSDIDQPGMQASRVRLWIGEYGLQSGELIGDPDLMFDGQVDQCSLEFTRDTRTVPMSVVSTAERLFERNSGNSLTPAFHKAIWPGELGHDNATGIGLPVAWGAASPGSQGTGGGTTSGAPRKTVPGDFG